MNFRKVNQTTQKYAPHNDPNVCVYWQCEVVEILLSKGKKVNALEYKSGPEEIEWYGSTYRQADKDYFLTLKNFNSTFDIVYNCFGYVFFESKFWFEPYQNSLDTLLAGKPAIELVLEFGNYQEINEPLPNCIALYYKDGYATHASRTKDGKIWLAKEGLKKGIVERSIQYNIKEYGSVKYFIELKEW